MVSRGLGPARRPLGRELGSASCECYGGRGCRAFSLLELMVVMGVLSLMVGLLLPAVGAAVERSRTTADSAVLRQNVMAVNAYCRDHRGVYPLSRPLAFHAAPAWYEAVTASGHVGQASECDPREFKRSGQVRFTLSVCMVYTPERMREGFTVPVDQAVSVAVGEHQVVYPSAKGLMHRAWDRHRQVEHGGVYFCCTMRVPSPVAMADGSVEVADFRRYHGSNPVVTLDLVGSPIWSTWGGYRARDK